MEEDECSDLFSNYPNAMMARMIAYEMWQDIVPDSS